MQGDSSVPHGLWSRHLAASSKKTREINQENEVDRQYTNYKSRQVAFASRRNAVSETNLFNGGEAGVADEDNNWDSQSDPGSVSSTNLTRFGPKYYVPGEIAGDTKSQNDLENLNKKGQSQKVCIQGRGRGQQIQLRRRNKPRDNVVAPGTDFVVEIPIEAAAGLVGPSDIPCPRYVHCYFDFVYYCCLTPNKWDMVEKEQLNKRQFSLYIVQKVSRDIISCI